MREITTNDADRELLSEFLRRGVALEQILIMYRCSEDELKQYVAAHFPGLSNMIAFCAQTVPTRGSWGNYPEVGWKKR